MPEPIIDYQQLADALIQRSAGLGTSLKAVSSTPTTTYGHGPGGLFSNPATERPIFSAMIMPRMGIEDRLPLRATQFESPLYAIFTGVTASSGSEPTGPCDDPPTAGLSKLCQQTSYLGRFSRMSRVFEVDRMGLLESRGEHTDFQFVGNPFNGANGATLPAIPGAQGLDGWLNNEIGKATGELGVAMRRDFARKVYDGNPTNNTASNGYQEFRGLDLLINTGYRDAITGVACAAADSIVRSFGNADIATNGATFVRQMTNIYRNLKFIARGAGLDPVKWVITCTWAAFYEATEVWPCAYATYRCTNLASGSTNFVDGAEMIRMRDEMRGDIYNRTGQYLLIDGERVEVVIDDGIAETQVAGSSFRSTFYFIPLTVLGGTPATYLEYLNYDAPNGALASARLMAPEGSYMTSDNGRFLWHKKPPTNYCVQFLVKTETRIILRAPYLAARLTNVQYTPVAHERDWDPAGPSYFVNGGQTTYTGYGPSYYTPTS